MDDDDLEWNLGLANLFGRMERRHVRNISQEGAYLIKIGEREWLLEVSKQIGDSLWGELCCFTEDDTGFDVYTDDNYVFRPVSQIPGTIVATLRGVG